MRLSLGVTAEHFEDVLGETFLDFSMPRDGLRSPGLRIAVPIVLRAVANQDTAESFDRLDQLRALHDITKSSTLRIPGISPLAMSW